MINNVNMHVVVVATQDTVATQNDVLHCSKIAESERRVRAGHVDASTTCALGGAYFDTSNLDFVVTIVGTAGLSRPELCFAAALVDLFAELGQYWVSGTGHRQ